jgi:hypothetical protein
MVGAVVLITGDDTAIGGAAAWEVSGTTKPFVVLFPTVGVGNWTGGLETAGTFGNGDAIDGAVAGVLAAAVDEGAEVATAGAGAESVLRTAAGVVVGTPFGALKFGVVTLLATPVVGVEMPRGRTLAGVVAVTGRGVLDPADDPVEVQYDRAGVIPAGGIVFGVPTKCGTAAGRETTGVTAAAGRVLGKVVGAGVCVVVAEAGAGDETDVAAAAGAPVVTAEGAVGGLLGTTDVLGPAAGEAVVVAGATVEADVDAVGTAAGGSSFGPPFKKREGTPSAAYVPPPTQAPRT